MDDGLDLSSLPFAYARKILVVAPHPDDETLGCGGLISLLAQNGAAFYIVFVTDGSASHRNSTAWPTARLAAQREQEARNALVCLGIAHAHHLFLRLPDVDMPGPGTPAWDNGVAAVSDILQRFAP